MSERKAHEQKACSRLTTHDSRLGFTLIELLLSLTIAVMVFAAIGGLLMASSQVAGLLDSRKDAYLENAMIALEKMKREVQESPVYPDVAFEGTSDKLVFPQFTRLSDSLNINTDIQLGRVETVTLGSGYAFQKISYFYDAGKKALMRQAGSGEAAVLIDHLSDVRFSYALASTPSLRTVWAAETPASGTSFWLTGISIKLLFDPAYSRYTIPGVQKVFIVARQHPTGSSYPDIETVRGEAVTS
ncbi:MAG: hypothetical protein HY592_02075 [Candidatus Omnitrophica bacterium]|nr:hypothetical protein [Candidatus Omnitrophota bacterium]